MKGRNGRCEEMALFAWPTQTEMRLAISVGTTCVPKAGLSRAALPVTGRVTQSRVTGSEAAGVKSAIRWRRGVDGHADGRRVRRADARLSARPRARARQEG